jgi:hypothetical protein
VISVVNCKPCLIPIEKSRVSIAGVGVGSSQCTIRSVSFSAGVRQGLSFVGAGSQAWSFFSAVFCSSLGVLIRSSLPSHPHKILRCSFCSTATVHAQVFDFSH